MMADVSTETIQTAVPASFMIVWWYVSGVLNNFLSINLNN